MFNYAKSRVPRELQQEQVLHTQRMMQGREQALREDAKHLALLMSQQGKRDPDDLMEQVQYWKFVHMYDRKYYEEVRRLARELIPHAKKMIPVVPNKQPAPGAGPGGPPGAAPASGPPPASPTAPVASANKQVKTAFLYLIREDGKPHKLMNSFASDIIMGNQQYVDEDGNTWCLRVSHKGSLTVKASSPSAIEAGRIHDHLPNEINKVVTKALRSLGVANPEDLAVATFARCRRSKTFDLMPVSLAISGASKAIMMLARVEGAMEPKEVPELRKAIGRVMAPYMARLKKALAMDGIEFMEIHSPLPPFVEQPSAAGHEDRPAPMSKMKVLGPNEVEASMDFRSLLMTTVSEKREDAARRLAFIMARHPQLAKASGICNEDLSPASFCSHGLAVSSIAVLIDGDDADVASAYVDGDDFLKMCISFLVVAQNRDNILAAMPGMCATDGILNIEFFSRLKAKDRQAADIIEEVARAGLSCPRSILGRKLIEVAAWHDDKLEACCLCDESCPYAIAKAMESGDEGKAKEIMSRCHALDTDPWAIIASKGASLAVIKAIPDRISSLLGRMAAISYMKVARVNWEGEPIPLAPDILSCPDNPLPLARSLVDIEDAAGLLLLLHKCSSAGQPESKAALEAMRIIVRALEGMGHAQEANSIIAKSGVSLGEDEADESLNSVMTMLRSGDNAGAAAAICRIFELEPSDAVTILDKLPEPSNPKLFLEMLPLELLAISTPSWAAGVKKKAISLPYGLVAVGGSGVYSVGNRTFASSDKGAFGLAAIVLAQGLGMIGDEPIERQQQKGQGHADTA